MFFFCLFGLLVCFCLNFTLKQYNLRTGKISSKKAYLAINKETISLLLTRQHSSILKKRSNRI